MKIRIETDDKLNEPEIIIRARDLDDDVMKFQAVVHEALARNRKLSLVKNDKEYFVEPENILFFESVDGTTFAHSRDNLFKVKMRLYELEEILPNSFVRASKSAIIGTRHILSISRNLAGPSLVQFRGSHKQINVSRSYYKLLRDKLNERSLR